MLLHFGYAFWLRIVSDMVTFWLRFFEFGYVLVTEIINMVTFWLRAEASRENFGYGRIWLRDALKCGRGCQKSIFGYVSKCAYLPRITKKFGYVF